MNKKAQEWFEAKNLEESLKKQLHSYTEEELKKFKKLNPAFRRGIPFYFENNNLIVPYARIIIRKRRNENEN